MSKISKEVKEDLFKKLLELERIAEGNTCGSCYQERVQGAYEMFKILGINGEYIKWRRENK